MDMKGASRSMLFLAVGGVTMAGIGAYAWLDYHRPGILELYVFDTPGAPTIFIRTPQDKRILIDGGSNSDIVRHITGVLPFYSRRIDMIIVTKPEGRIVTGLIDVLHRYDIGQLVLPGITLDGLGLAGSADPVYEVFLETVTGINIKVRNVVAGESIDLDEKVRLMAVFPAAPEQFEYSKASAPQLLFRIEYGGTSLVYMGDATPKVQKYVTSLKGSATDALVVSTSLAATNISQELIASFRPDYLVYSQAITKNTVKTHSSSAKAKADPVAGILEKDRFNVRKTGIVKAVSGGKSLSVEAI